MLDNEPKATHTQESGAPSGTPPTPDAKTPRKRTTKRTTKKTTQPPTDHPLTTSTDHPTTASGDQSATSAGEAAAVAGDQAAAGSGGRQAKKTAKRTAKKVSAKRTSKKAAAASDDSAESSVGTVIPVTAAAVSDDSAESSAGASAPRAAVAGTEATATGDGSQDGAVKKATRKRTSKKAAAKKLAAIDPAAVDAAAAPSGEAESSDDVAAEKRRAAAAAAVLFQAPVEVDEPNRRRTRKRGEAEPEAQAEDEQPGRRTRKRVATEPEAERDEQPRRRTRKRAEAVPEGESEGERPGRRTRKRVEPGDVQEAPEAEADEDADQDTDSAEGDGEGGRRRRRRRGGRRRRKSGEAADADETDEEETEASADETTDEAESADEDGEGSGTSRRRRRRRRRKGEDSAASPDDPDETVVRVREPRAKGKDSEITAVEGSTRLEAKKQRRREGRAAGRRRAPIVSEAEFLARRESVERTMVIRARGDLTQIAVSEDNVLVEHYVAQAEQTSLIGNVYLGRVQNVLPSMEAAFIDIGKGRNAVLYAGEVDWATLGATNGQRKIESVLKSGQSVLVQVTKDPVGHKGARLTNQISLPGRYVVYVPRGGNGGISRKLPDTERNRLKGILKDIVPDEAGVIVRTAAEGASEEELTRDVSRLKSYWDEIEKKSGNGQAPQLLYGEPDLLIRVVRDLFTEDFTKLVISGDEAFDLVNEYVSYVAPHLADRVEKWTSDGEVFANFRIDEQIKKALDRKVWLPSGGSLIIDRTEAMTVVDVNTGKFTGSGGNLEETVTRNNLEAAEEIVRQLRLRDIGGIIVVDFIDMVLESNRELVLRRLVECLGRDRTKHQVAEVTSLGLVQMTRKRIGTGLLEAFSETCDHCGGRGLILHDEPREPRKRQAEEPAKSSKRASRGKGRKKQEPVEEQSSDAAQRLAEIAAATVNKESEPELAVAPV